MDRTADVASRSQTPPAETTAMNVLLALSLSHMLNDILQAVLPAIYPVLKESFHLNLTQIGLITFAYQLTASILQPLVGLYTDRYPRPYALAVGMCCTLSGLVMLSQATTYNALLIAAALTGTGSSIFHPGASRLTRLASGGRHGFAQSLFQVGGNLGTSFGPLLVAFIIGTRGQSNVLWFSLFALLGIVILMRLGSWHHGKLQKQKAAGHPAHHHITPRLPRKKVTQALVVLLALIFSKYIYLTSLTNYYTFYLIDRFGVSIQRAQIYLFVFLFAVALGTILGGPIGDRYGRKIVIWFSILGTAPFTLMLPFAGLTGTIILSVFIGSILASAFSAILVYAQDLLPGNVGLVAGLFFGLAFGIAGVGSALLGRLADHTSIEYVYRVCSFLPLLGLLTVFLPDLNFRRTPTAVQP
ncbi:MAG: MFS transporter [Verrucomicrobia bacterium]|nr:MFS transporter [Verrucomicrobiota bacterium]